jgi:Tfp pilus assembly protein PilF
MPKVNRQKIDAFKKGRVTLAEVFAIDSKQIAALLMTGYLLYEAQRYQQAKGIFEGFLVLDPRNSYVHGILGSIYQKEGKYAAAVDRYTVALALSPDDINSLSNRGEIFLRMGKFSEAATDLFHAIKLDSAGKHPAANRARMLVALTQEVLKMAKENGVESVLQATKKIDQQFSSNRG